jgi:hypothetical protein
MQKYAIDSLLEKSQILYKKRKLTFHESLDLMENLTPEHFPLLVKIKDTFDEIYKNSIQPLN